MICFFLHTGENFNVVDGSVPEEEQMVPLFQLARLFLVNWDPSSIKFETKLTDWTGVENLIVQKASACGTLKGTNFQQFTYMFIC